MRFFTNRFHARCKVRVNAKRLRKSVERLLAALQEKLSEVDSETDGTVRGTPAWWEKEDLLASVPGV